MIHCRIHIGSFFCEMYAKLFIRAMFDVSYQNGRLAESDAYDVDANEQGAMIYDCRGHAYDAGVVA
jgi:hypothetical protein